MSLTQMLFNEQLPASQVQASPHAGIQQARISPEEYARQQLASWQRQNMPSLFNRGLDSSNTARYIRESEQAARKTVKVESLVGISPLIPAGIAYVDPMNFAKRVKPEPEQVKTEIPKQAPTEPKFFGHMARFARKPKPNAKCQVIPTTNSYRQAIRSDVKRVHRRQS